MAWMVAQRDYWCLDGATKSIRKIESLRYFCSIHTKSHLIHIHCTKSLSEIKENYFIQLKNVICGERRLQLKEPKRNCQMDCVNTMLTIESVFWLLIDWLNRSCILILYRKFGPTIMFENFKFCIEFWSIRGTFKVFLNRSFLFSLAKPFHVLPFETRIIQEMNSKYYTK